MRGLTNKELMLAINTGCSFCGLKGAQFDVEHLLECQEVSRLQEEMGMVGPGEPRRVSKSINCNSSHLQVSSVSNKMDPQQQQKPFVLKKMPKKKANPQRKMKQFFQVVKASAPKVEKNFQGMPMTECVYEDLVGKDVYFPPGWGGLEDDGTRSNWKLCTSCCLRPCVVTEKLYDIFEFAEKLKLFSTEENDNETIVCQTYNHCETILADIFNKRYVRKFWLPCCLTEAIREKYPFDDASLGVEAEDNDQELEWEEQSAQERSVCPPPLEYQLTEWKETASQKSA